MGKHDNASDPDLSVFTNGQFWSPTCGALSLDGVIGEIKEFINEDTEASYRVIIGSDSQAKRINGEAEIDFVSAIVAHRQGRGGRYFWHKTRQRKKYVLRDKIYTETWLSLQLAEKLVPELRRAIPAGRYDLEIHIDVGPIGPTREMIKEVVGMVTGSGYTAKTKPESYGASSIADKHT
jgi:uncharacterized protein